MQSKADEWTDSHKAELIRVMDDHEGLKMNIIETISSNPKKYPILAAYCDKTNPNSVSNRKKVSQYRYNQNRRPGGPAWQRQVEQQPPPATTATAVPVDEHQVQQVPHQTPARVVLNFHGDHQGALALQGGTINQTTHNDNSHHAVHNTGNRYVTTTNTRDRYVTTTTTRDPMEAIVTSEDYSSPIAAKTEAQVQSDFELAERLQESLYARHQDGTSHRVEGDSKPSALPLFDKPRSDNLESPQASTVGPVVLFEASERPRPPSITTAPLLPQDMHGQDSPASVVSQLSLQFKEARSMPVDLGLDKDYSNGITLSGPDGRPVLDKEAAKDLVRTWSVKVLEGKNEGRVVKKLSFSSCPVRACGAKELVNFLTQHVRNDVQFLDLTEVLTQTDAVSGPAVMTSICGALRGAPQLEYFVCQKVALSPDAAHAVAEFFKSLPKDKLVVVSLIDSGLDVKSFQSVLSALSPIASCIKTFALGEVTAASDHEDDTALKAIGGLMAAAPNLENLDLHDLRGGMIKNAWGHVVNALLWITMQGPWDTPSNNLKVLDLSDATLGCDEGCSHQVVSLITVLGHSNIKKLNLSGTGLGPEGSKLVFNGLKDQGHHQIEEISLEAVELGEEGATCFGEFLSTQTDISKLNVAETEIGDAGLSFILDGLKANTKKMEYLNIATNDLGDDSFERLDSFLTEVEVGHLSMEGNGLDAQEPQAISIKKRCKKVDLDTPISVAGSFNWSPSSLASSEQPFAVTTNEQATGTEAASPTAVNVVEPSATLVQPTPSTNVLVANQPLPPKSIAVSTNESPQASEEAPPSQGFGGVELMQPAPSSDLLVANQPLPPESIAVSTNGSPAASEEAPPSQGLGNTADEDLLVALEQDTQAFKKAQAYLNLIKPVIDVIGNQKRRPLFTKLLNHICQSDKKCAQVAVILHAPPDLKKALGWQQVPSKRKHALQYHGDNKLFDNQLCLVLPMIIAILWVDMGQADRKAMFAEGGDIYKAVPVNPARELLKNLGKEMDSKKKKNELIPSLFNALVEKLPDGLW